LLNALCLFFCAGIIFGAYFKIRFQTLYCLAFITYLLCGLCLKKDKAFLACIFILSFLLGGLFFKNTQVLANNHIAKIFSYNKAEAVKLKAIVVSQPQERQRHTNFVLEAKELIQDKRSIKICGKVFARTPRIENLAYGQELILEGKLYRPPNFALSNRLRYREFLAQQEIYVFLSVSAEDRIEFLDRHKANRLQDFSFWLKDKAARILDTYLSQTSATVLKAMLLGERQAVPSWLNTIMIYTGTVHILVVSGLMVGIVAFVILLFLKVLGLRRRLRFLLAIILLFFYCLLTGANVSAVRSTIMATAIFLAYLFKRQPNIYNSLSLAALLILIFRPQQFFNVGFQLSFASVLAILLLSSKIHLFLSQRLRNLRPLDKAMQIFSVSLAAWLGTVGLVAYYFGIVSFIAVVANLLVVPLAFLIAASGFVLIISGVILPGLAALFSLAPELFLVLLIKINAFLARLPLAYVKIRAVGFIYVFIYYLLLVMLALSMGDGIIIFLRTKQKEIN